jgi:hypothetical protein
LCSIGGNRVEIYRLTQTVIIIVPARKPAKKRCPFSAKLQALGVIGNIYDIVGYLFIGSAVNYRTRN